MFWLGSPDFVAIFEKKLGKAFYLAFLSLPKKWIVNQNKINLGEKTDEVTLVWESMLNLLLLIY